VRKPLVGIGLGLGAALIAIALGRLSFVQTVELKTYDWRMRATADPAAASKDIVIVHIDEESLRLLAPYFGRWPWPRVVHAHALSFLARARPKVVLYDIFFGGPDHSTFKIGDEQWTGERSDAELADQARRVGAVVFPGDATEEAPSGGAPAATLAPLPGPNLHLDGSIESRPIFSPPMPALLGSARAIAENLMVGDVDGVVRRYVPAVRVDGRVVPSLAVAGAIIALGVKDADVHQDDAALWIGDRRLPLVTSSVPTLDGSLRSSRRAQIPYRGVWSDQRRTYPTYSFAQLFQAEEQILADERPTLDPAMFRDKVVVVGATAAGLYDQKAVPFPQKMSGPEIHAQMIDGILANHFLAPAPLTAGFVLTGLVALAAALVTTLVGPWAGVTVALGLAGALVVGLSALFGRGTWMPLVEPLLAVAMATFGGVVYQYAVEGREKRRVKRIFSRYVSKDVYQQLIDSPTEAGLGGNRRFMTVLFTDIRGFTVVSEQGQPEAIVAQLNQYFSAMVPIVFAHKGTVDKFVGDTIMALYGAPLDDPEHAEHAVQTALAMTEELARLNTEWAADGRPTLDIGVGINTGDMVAGNLGSESIMSYTVIGDNVNLGARLESLTRNFQTRLIISDATRQALKGSYDVRDLGDVIVKGKSRPVKIFEVVLPASINRALNVYSPLASPADKDKAETEASKSKES
jgi:adenylate cyclase